MARTLDIPERNNLQIPSPQDSPRRQNSSPDRTTRKPLVVLTAACFMPASDVARQFGVRSFLAEIPRLCPYGRDATTNGRPALQGWPRELESRIC